MSRARYSFSPLGPDVEDVSNGLHILLARLVGTDPLQDATEGHRRLQEATGRTRRYQDATGGYRRLPEAPGGLKRVQK
eukprot:7544504-Pyramimonas_sp.AAC.1